MRRASILIILSLFAFSFLAMPVIAQLPNPADLASQAEEAKKKMGAEKAAMEATAAKTAEEAAAAKTAMFQRVLYMNYNSTAVATTSQGTLDEILNGLDNVKQKIQTAPPGTVLVITGHADSTGNDEYNMDLSLKRANAIKALILKQGVIEDSMISVKAKGEMEPEAEGEHAKNRRVVLKLDYEG